MTGSMGPDPASAPRYRQILHDLRAAIVAGRMRPGSLAPSERALEERYGVSRITARRALDELARSHLIARGRGRRATVLGPPGPEPIRTVRDDLAHMLRFAHDTEVSVLEFEWRVATDAVAHDLMVEEGDQVLFVARLRRRFGSPIFITHVHLPRRIGILIDRRMLETAPILDVMADQGVEIASYDQTLSAAPCPGWVAPLLELAEGAPTFRIDRIVRDRQGLAVQRVTLFFRWDAYTYRMTALCQDSRSEGARDAPDQDSRAASA